MFIGINENIGLIVNLHYVHTSPVTELVWVHVIGNVAAILREGFTKSGVHSNT